MRKTKTEKGVTLIVLIITIVVLLILAAVAINNITNDGIISKTQNSAEKFNEAQLNKQEMLNEAFEELNGNGGSGVTKQIEIGAYVEYDVSYTDVHKGTTFTSTNGWRYLGEEAGTGNKLLISTGKPLFLVHSDSDVDNKKKWWDADTTLNANVRAANGMISNFDRIPYAQMELPLGSSVMFSSGMNAAYGGFAPNKKTYEGAEYDAVGDYFKVTGKTYSNDIIKVRTLTLAELNRAVNSASGSNRAETSTASGFEDLTGKALGLFNLQDLDGYPEGMTTFFLVSHCEGNSTNYEMFFVNVRDKEVSKVVEGGIYNGGIRPVVVLSSDVELKDTNGDGVYEIK